MPQNVHLAEFAATVTGDTARTLMDAYREALGDPALGQADIVSRLKMAMESKLAEQADAPPPALDK